MIAKQMPMSRSVGTLIVAAAIPERDFGSQYTHEPIQELIDFRIGPHSNP